MRIFPKVSSNFIILEQGDFLTLIFLRLFNMIKEAVENPLLLGASKTTLLKRSLKISRNYGSTSRLSNSTLFSAGAGGQRFRFCIRKPIRKG